MAGLEERYHPVTPQVRLPTSTPLKPQFDPTPQTLSLAIMEAYTQSVINSIGPNATPRVKEVFPVLIRKLHEFADEVDLSVDEWLDACKLMIQAGKISDDKRNEMILVSDVLGLESLVDMLQHKRHAKNSVQEGATASAILGPFFRENVPVQENGSSILKRDEKGAPHVYLHGQVRNSSGKPIPGALIDVWHDAPNGLYDSQDPNQPGFHCRGRFKADKDGRYSLICLKPTPYPIPFDNAAGALLKLMDRHPNRPAHIHFLVVDPEDKHHSLVTQIFDRESKWLNSDAVFAVKDELVVDFKKTNRPGLDYELEYDLVIAPNDEALADIEGHAQ